jgi:hypothetical protein
MVEGERVKRGDNNRIVAYLRMSAEESSGSIEAAEHPPFTEGGTQRRLLATEQHIYILPQSFATFFKKLTSGISTTSISAPQLIVSFYRRCYTITARLLKWRSARTVALAGSMTTILGIIVNIAFIQPTFEGVLLASQSLDLPKWTALKDFRENCEHLPVGSL